MNVDLKLQGTCITFEQGDVQQPDGTFRLLADIAKQVTVQPGRFAAIDTPLWVAGDGSTIALIDVVTSRAPGSQQFMVPPRGERERIVAVVLNDTPNPIIISPSNAIGFVSFSLLDAGADAEADADAAPAAIDGAMVIPTVYEPVHIDRTLRPSYGTPGAAAFDMRADVAEPFTLAGGERRTIETGLRMAIPIGYEGQIRPRSGLASKHGITVTNSPATIDSDYRGEIKVVLQNLGDEPFTVEPGDRIAQMLIAPVVQAHMDFRSDLDDTERGHGGFGSTGTR